MAKNKGTRILITLECTDCRSNLNKRSPGVSRYSTQKNRRNNPERLELKKYLTQHHKGSHQGWKSEGQACYREHLESPPVVGFNEAPTDFRKLLPDLCFQAIDRSDGLAEGDPCVHSNLCSQHYLGSHLQCDHVE